MRRFFGSALLALLTLFVVTPFAFASQTAALLPATVGNYQQWSPKSGANHVTMVDESSCNGTTDYNQETTVTQRDSYGISLASIPDGSTITQINITPCASRNTTGTGSSTFNVFYRLNSVNSADAGAYALANTATPVVLSTTSFSGLAATKSSGTTFEIGGVYSAGTRGVRLSQISTQITYTPLATPSGLTAAATGSAVTLNWVDNSSNETGFKIERSDNGGAFNQIASVSANVKTYLDPGLATGTYAYRVRAYNAGGNSGYTATATAYVLVAPSNMLATATGSAIAISWKDNSSNEDGFKIEIATGAGSFVLFKTVGPNVATSSATNLSANTYAFRVRAYKATSNSDYSNTDDAVVLVSPSGAFATVANVDITLNWTDNSSNEDGFKIERSSSGSNFIQIATVSAGVTSYFDSGLSSGFYTYRVRAYNNGGDNSNYANASTVYVILAPSGLTAVASGSAVTLTWADNADNELGFKIERSDNGGAFNQIATVSANVTTYPDSGLAAGTYVYKVRAYRLTNNSDYSNVDDAVVFDAPTGLGTSVVGSDVTLNWTDNATGEDGFRVERADNGGSFVEIGTVASDVTTYFDPGLATGSYDYRIRTYKTSDTSSYSATASAIVP